MSFWSKGIKKSSLCRICIQLRFLSVNNKRENATEKVVRQLSSQSFSSQKDKSKCKPELISSHFLVQTWAKLRSSRTYRVILNLHFFVGAFP